MSEYDLLIFGFKFRYFLAMISTYNEELIQISAQNTIFFFYFYVFKKIN